MTAEIAIINRQAIALAADSAVTIGKEKVWKTANKLFSLGPHHDIAIMIYGTGDYLRFPWEVVIKTFRQRVVKDRFATVADCARRFTSDFLIDPAFSERNAHDVSVLFPQFDYYKRIYERTRQDGGSFEEDEVRREIDLLKEYLARKEVLLPDLDEVAFKEHFRDLLFECVKSFFDESIADGLRDDFLDLAFAFFRAKEKSGYATGLVVAGYGESEFFPALHHFTVDGRFNDVVRFWPEDDCIDMNDPANTAAIIPFAQRDMSILFLEGMAPGYQTFLKRSIEGVIRESLLDFATTYLPNEDERERAKQDALGTSREAAKRLLEKFAAHRHEHIVSPILTAVSALPKEEMAAMCEALVDLTSLRRKVDSNLETVGGPVDVAVISKGDGFVWLKRKHYFRLDLNRDFAVRKQIREEEED